MHTMHENKGKLQACMGRKDRSAKGAFAGDNATRSFLQIGANWATCTGENEKTIFEEQDPNGVIASVPLKEITRLPQGRILCTCSLTHLE